MDNSTILKKLDETIEHFKKDITMFSDSSSKPASQKDLHDLSVMVLNALGDIKKAFE